MQHCGLFHPGACILTPFSPQKIAQKIQLGPSNQYRPQFSSSIPQHFARSNHACYTSFTCSQLSVHDIVYLSTRSIGKRSAGILQYLLHASRIQGHRLPGTSIWALRHFTDIATRVNLLHLSLQKCLQARVRTDGGACDTSTARRGPYNLGFFSPGLIQHPGASWPDIKINLKLPAAIFQPREENNWQVSQQVAFVHIWTPGVSLRRITTSIHNAFPLLSYLDLPYSQPTNLVPAFWSPGASSVYR